MTELIASPTLEKSIAKILYHTEKLVSEIDRLNAENNALREEIRLIRLNDGPMKNLTELEKDKARLDWIDRERDERSRASITGQLDHHLMQGWKAREAIDATAGYWEPEFINWYEETAANA